MTALTFLDIGKNLLGKIALPEGLTRLTVLRLFKNELTNFTLPVSMINLAELNLSQNQLTRLTLPPGLTRLASLDVTGNLLTSFTLPAGLTNLSELFLAAKQLASLTLPPDINQLGTLDLAANPLTALVLSEPLAATNLAETVSSLQNENISVFTYPLTLQLISPRQTAQGTFGFALTGPPGVYILFGSTDLFTWSDLGAFTNNVGVVRFDEATSTLASQKFFRARSLP